ncbi:hypothetical protein [Paenibacillus thalictri]|uniref:Uncharacterized protein n=1 Tax=Paenibacillus thalictri TaxID=2527873 RepID=A0A4Q9DF43_9BACL|nr:hypothetical protein [Paenibacillus thalictri]TBL68553.1 hypothetical protein EYB31_37770 [Paenibacillus thalictri]
MPVIPIQRITSRTTNVVGAANRATAIASVLANQPGNTVNVSGAYPNWPSLTPYTNDNNTSFSGITPPQTIWTVNPPLPGTTQGFAVRSVSIPLSVSLLGADFVFNVAVFADNAHNLQIQAYNAVSLELFTMSNLNVILNDGSLALDSSFTTDSTKPYNWQQVRYYTITGSTGAIAVALGVFFVISFEVANYDTNKGLNTAGLSFVTDIYGADIVVG